MPEDDMEEIIGNPSIYFALAVAGLFFGSAFLFIGILVGLGDPGFGNLFYLCSAGGLIPGFILLAIGMKIRKKIRDLESLGEVLQAYRRMGMAEIARKLGVSEFEAESQVARAIDMGFVKGHIDHNTHEFFTVESMGQVIHLDNCPKCGAPREKLYLEGEIVRCEACGSVI